jgi:hypothetical protein
MLDADAMTQDGVAASALSRAEGAPDEQAPPSRGPLLDEPDGKKVARMVRDLVDAQKGWHSYNCAIWSRNRQWRKGRRGIRIVEDTDTNTFDVRLPAGASQAAPTPNNIDKLIRRVVATLTVDPPRAEVSPETGEDRDRDAAEFAERLLALDADAHLRAIRTVGDLAGTYASAFVHSYIHPQGERVPVALEAHPAATSIAAQITDPATGEVTQGEPDPASALNDPATGVPGLDGETVVKYLSEDGVTLLDEPAGAQLRWEPKLCREIVSSKTVWFLPVNCTGVEDADGMVLGYVTTLGQLEGQYPEIATWDEKRREALCGWRPDGAKRWLHPMMESAMKAAVKDGTAIRSATGDLSPESPVFCYRLYYQVHGTYPDGAMVVTSGDELLYREAWSATVSGRWEALPIPVAQFRWRDDANDQSPYGIAGAEELGPSEEVRAAQMSALVEYLWRFNHPHVYLPIGSKITPGMLAKRDGTPMPVNMDGSGKPVYEQIPGFPAESLTMYQLLGQEQQSAVGLEEAAMGVASPTVNSGKHAQQIIEQALVALANQVQNLSDCYTRMCRVELALKRAFFDAPRLSLVTAEGGMYKMKRWQGSDLVGAKDVRIMRGTLTMMSPERKQQMALQELEVSRANGDPLAFATYRQVTHGALAPMIGAQDDEQRMRIERQVNAWLQGPTDDVQAAEQQFQQSIPMLQQQYAQQTQQAQMQAQQTGQPAQVPPFEQAYPSPMQQAVQQVFKPLPVDAEPAAAQIRWQVLRDTVAKVRVASFPAPWQVGLFQSYDVARKAAGVMTVAEQQQAAQQAQQAEAAKETQKVQAETQQKVQLKQMDAALDAQRDAQKGQMELEREAVQAAARSQTDGGQFGAA